MSRGNVEVVRQPIALAARSRRRLEERFRLRFPRADARLTAAIWRVYSRLSARSRLRQAIARHTSQVAIDALNRRDLESAFSRFHPDGESVFDERLVSLGFEPVYRGREARIAAQREWMAAWGEIRFDAEELIDLGDNRGLVLGQLRGSGLSSGAGGEVEVAFLYTFSAGLAVHEKLFSTHGEALEAVGLRE